MTLTRLRINSKQVIALAGGLLTAWLLYSGIFDPEGILMSFANSGAVHTWLRATVLVSLAIVLVSKPPRSTPVRMVLATLSSAILMGASASMMDYHIGILDAIVYLQVSIILAIEAIENQKAPVQFSRIQTTN